MAYNKKKAGKKLIMTRSQAEELSRRNVKQILTGQDKLKSYGHSGWYKSRKQDKWFHYRSSIELGILKVLEESPKIVDYDTECFAIKYFFGVNLHYIPDIICKTDKGKVFVIEVKPSNQLLEEKNIAKWETAKTWCFENRAKFWVITEKDSSHLIEILEKLEDNDVPAAIALGTWSPL